MLHCGKSRQSVTRPRQSNSLLGLQPPPRNTHFDSTLTAKVGLCQRPTSRHVIPVHCTLLGASSPPAAPEPVWRTPPRPPLGADPAPATRTAAAQGPTWRPTPERGPAGQGQGAGDGAGKVWVRLGLITNQGTPHSRRLAALNPVISFISDLHVPLSLA